jgi:hypothetical protein
MSTSVLGLDMPRSIRVTTLSEHPKLAGGLVVTQYPPARHALF